MNIAQRAATHLSIAACAAGALWLGLHSSSDADGVDGLAAWERSCPDATHGLCLADASPRAHVPGELPQRCGPESLALPAVRARDVGELASALAAFSDAVMLPARAKLALVDLDLESKMLARRVPIADQVSDAWKREFAAWWTETQRLAGELRTRYEVVVGAGDREVSVAAALRIAQVDRFVTDLLLSSRIPDSLRTGEFADDKVEAYCDALTQAAEPLEQRTVAELASCLRIASAVTEGVDDAKSLEAVLAWSDVCADQLAQLQPDKLHAVNEAFGPRHPLARLHIRLRNFDAANRVLDRAPVDYDVLNAMAINVRHRGDLSLAEYGYRQAIALDEARPEAHFNLALLEKAASLRLEPREALVRYRKAIELFLHAQSRATGELKREVETQLVLATKTIAAIEKFLAAQAP